MAKLERKKKWFLSKTPCYLFKQGVFIFLSNLSPVKGVVTMHTFIDLFAGIGGFRLGMEENNFKCVFSCEIDEFARQTYEANFGDTPFSDIRLLDNQNLLEMPNFDVLTAGFPCQPFSISGKQEGFEDLTRGTLFFEITRIIQIKKPKAVFLENVAHLVNHDGGRTFKVILRSLEELGYHVFHKVLDSSNFSLPQHRKRIYIVAFREKVDFQFPTIHKGFVPLREVLEKNKEYDYLSEEDYSLIENPKVSPNNMCFVGYLNKNGRKKGVREGSFHLSRSHKQINRIYSHDFIHPTLTSSEKSGRYYILDENGVRKLSLLEAFRLQGYPDSFIKPVSPSQQYQQIGNSVPVNVIKEISKQIEIVL